MRWLPSSSGASNYIFSSDKTYTHCCNHLCFPVKSCELLMSMTLGFPHPSCPLILSLPSPLSFTSFLSLQGKISLLLRGFREFEWPTNCLQHTALKISLCLRRKQQICQKPGEFSLFLCLNYKEIQSSFLQNLILFFFLTFFKIMLQIKEGVSNQRTAEPHDSWPVLVKAEKTRAASSS